MWYDPTQENETKGWASNLRNFAQNKAPSYERQLADLYREQWEDYKDRFYPLENSIFEVFAPGYVPQQGMDALNEINKTYDNSQAATERSLKSYGVQLTPEQKQANAQSMDISQGKARVNAFNSSVNSAKDRQFGLFGGGFSRELGV